jgi:MscS family membrane protein
MRRPSLDALIEAANKANARESAMDVTDDKLGRLEKQMYLPRENRRGISKSLNWPLALRIALAIFLFVGSTARSPAQLPKSAAPPPPTAEPVTPIDPLGRETPRGAMMGLLKYSERDDYETAARYLQPTPKKNTNLTQRAKELHALLQNLKGNIGLLSDAPDGTVGLGLPPSQVQAGVLSVGGKTVDVILVRVDDKTSGKIWLISKDTVAEIPKLYAQLEGEAPTVADQIIPFIPAALTARRLLGMSLARWLGWLLSIPISLLLAWLLALLLSTPARIRCKVRKLPFTTIWPTRVGTSLTCIVAILIHALAVKLLQPPLLYRVYYFRFLVALLAGCCVWLVSTITDRGFEEAVNRTRAQHKGGESILMLMRRLTSIVLLTVALLVALAIFGVNVKTTLAGLGIGGLALALAAQKALENLIGGVSLLMDKAVEVGDFCQIGDRRGTVEEIGLRSLKLRTLDQNLLVVPNGLLAQMQFENMTSRPKLLINQTFLLRIETQAEQLRYVLDRVQSMLDQHPEIEPETPRIRIADFAGAAFELELFAYAKTGDWAHLTAIRQDVVLKIAEIVEAAGARFAAPTRLTYQAKDEGVDTDKANPVVPRVTELRASDSFRFPGESRTGTE